jgi:Na+/H+ antiporter NhaC
MYLNHAGTGHFDASRRAVAGIAQAIDAQAAMLAYLIVTGSLG